MMSSLSKETKIMIAISLGLAILKCKRKIHHPDFIMTNDEDYIVNVYNKIEHSLPVEILIDLSFLQEDEIMVESLIDLISSQVIAVQFKGHLVSKILKHFSSSGSISTASESFMRLSKSLQHILCHSNTPVVSTAALEAVVECIILLCDRGTSLSIESMCRCGVLCAVLQNGFRHHRKFSQSNKFLEELVAKGITGTTSVPLCNEFFVLLADDLITGRNA